MPRSISTKPVQELIESLGAQVAHFPPPIHVVAVCTGGQYVGKYILKYLKRKQVPAKYFEAWTNFKNGRTSVWKTDFSKRDYTGTVVLAEDAIWQGRSVNAVKRMVHRLKKKKVYTAVLIDFNNHADFAVFRSQSH